MSFADYLAREARMVNTIKVLRKREYINVSKCVIAFNVSRRILNNRRNRTISKSTRISTKKRFIEKQEQSIVDYVICNFEKDIILTIKNVKKIANYILDNAIASIEKQ